MRQPLAAPRLLRNRRPGEQSTTLGLASTERQPTSFCTASIWAKCSTIWTTL
jgi:hypothetical protein